MSTKSGQSWRQQIHASALVFRRVVLGAMRAFAGLRRQAQRIAPAAALISVFGSLPIAQAAQVCFDQAGAAGALTVTQSGPGCGNFLTFGGITGLYMGESGVTEACTFNVSPAIVGNTLRVKLTAHSCNNTSFCEEARFSLNGSHYAVSPAEIDNTQPPGGDAVQVTGAGDIVEAPGGTSDGRATISFNSAPAAVNSITINHVITLGAPAGTIYSVCADDGGAVIGATTTAVVSSLNPSQVGQAVTFTATVTGASPTGTVQFRDGATNLGAPVTLVAGSGAFTTSALAAGTHAITAVYSGDANNTTSTSPAVNQVVNAPLAGTIAVPTLSEWALGLLATLMALLGLRAHRRVRATR